MAIKEKIEVLLVDDDEAGSKLVAQFLEKAHFNITLATSANQAISLLSERHYPIVVSDIILGGADGLTLIPHIKKLKWPSLIIFMTGHGSLGTAVKAIGEGAFDYLSKSMDLETTERELTLVMERALQQLGLDKARYLAPLLEKELLLAVPKSMIGESPSIVKLYRSIAKTAQSSGNVLILGESGTGKELVAHAIHDNSPRSANHFVTVNCSALTETLLESELFGHVKGSFTGATSNKIGLFEEANGGTIFLDEIGDISPALQVKLLRVIQEGEIKPVGAVESRKVDVRVIAATHRDLEALIKNGTFREDLFYRLKVFLLVVPPLRERKQDLPDLIRHFISRLAETTGRRVESISEDALQLLLSHNWPGNIRELENVIERAAGMASTTVLYTEDFPPEIGCRPPQSSPALVPERAELNSLEDVVEAVEREHIAKVLESVNYNKSKASERLGIDRGTLYRKAIQYKIPLKAPKKEKSEPPAERAS